MKWRISIYCLIFVLFGYAAEYGKPESLAMDTLHYKNTSSAFNRLIIYQVMVESFQDGDTTRNYDDGYGTSHHCGDLRGITNALPYIKSLNVNAIWLTPIFDSEKGTPRVNPDFPADTKLDATGYYARNYFKIDPNFGTLEDARELVGTAHELGLYVFFDGVFGHHKGDVPASPRGYKPVGPNTQVKYPESLAFFKEVALYWIDELEIDGWRLDQAYQIPVPYLQEIRKAVEDRCRERKAEGKEWGTLGYMVGEIFDLPRVIAKKGYGTEEQPGLLSNFNFPVRYRIVQCLAGEEKGLRIPDCSVLSEGMATHEIYPDFALPNLMLTNHDLVRFGDLIQRNGLENPDHPNYWKRHQCAFGFMAAYNGPITIFYGDEIGEELENFAQKIDDPAEKCWEKGLCDDHVSRISGRISDFTTEERELKSYLAGLLDFRQKHPALYNGKTINLISEGNLYADLKIHQDEKILFVMNIGAETENLLIGKDYLKSTSLVDCFSGEKIAINQEIFHLRLEGLTTKFYYCR
jgi:glycosidase